jgi:arsenite methyltransferase
VAGALAERDFVKKLEKAGFVGIEVVERRTVPLEEFALSPLFTDDLIELMRALIPAQKQESVATAIVLTARRAGS